VANTEASADLKMNVQHIIDKTRAAGEGTSAPDEWFESITAVPAVTNASIMGETTSADGGNVSIPSGQINLWLSDIDTVTMWRATTNHSQTYCFSVVEWPKSEISSGMLIEIE
jgi:hypothetical protein